jgi:hypothetical protein
MLGGIFYQTDFKSNHHAQKSLSAVRRGQVTDVVHRIHHKTHVDNKKRLFFNCRRNYSSRVHFDRKKPNLLIIGHYGTGQ